MSRRSLPTVRNAKYSLIVSGLLLVATVGLGLVTPVPARAAPALGFTPTPEPTATPTPAPTATPAPTSLPRPPARPTAFPTPELTPPFLPETGVGQANDVPALLTSVVLLAVGVSLTLLTAGSRHSQK